jgi:hypothetical protein
LPNILIGSTFKRIVGGAAAVADVVREGVGVGCRAGVGGEVAVGFVVRMFAEINMPHR